MHIIPPTLPLGAPEGSLGFSKCDVNDGDVDVIASCRASGCVHSHDEKSHFCTLLYVSELVTGADVMVRKAESVSSEYFV